MVSPDATSHNRRLEELRHYGEIPRVPEDFKTKLSSKRSATSTKNSVVRTNDVYRTRHQQFHLVRRTIVRKAILKNNAPLNNWMKRSPTLNQRLNWRKFSCQIRFQNWIYTLVSVRSEFILTTLLVLRLWLSTVCFSLESCHLDYAMPWLPSKELCIGCSAICESSREPILMMC